MNKLEKIENAVKFVVTLAAVAITHVTFDLGDKEIFHAIGVLWVTLSLTALSMAIIATFTPLGDYYKRTVRPRLLKRWGINK